MHPKADKMIVGCIELGGCHPRKLAPVLRMERVGVILEQYGRGFFADIVQQVSAAKAEYPFVGGRRLGAPKRCETCKK